MVITVHTMISNHTIKPVKLAIKINTHSKMNKFKELTALSDTATRPKHNTPLL